MKRIHLYRNNAGWQARFIDDTEIIALFGTDIVPTAFTKLAAKSTVVREITRLNPGYQVEAWGNETI